MQKRVVKLNIPCGRDGGKSENSRGGAIAPLLPKFLLSKWTGLVSVVVKVAKQSKNLLMNGFLNEISVEFESLISRATFIALAQT